MTSPIPRHSQDEETFLTDAYLEGAVLYQAHLEGLASAIRTCRCLTFDTGLPDASIGLTPPLLTLVTQIGMRTTAE
jgi:hypothetical protein